MCATRKTTAAQRPRDNRRAGAGQPARSIGHSPGFGAAWIDASEIAIN